MKKHDCYFIYRLLSFSEEEVGTIVRNIFVGLH